MNDKFIIKPGTFKGTMYTQYNCQTVTKEIDRDSGEVLKGVSGNTTAYKTVAGGRLYLKDEQVEAIS